jgi:hypothetical protein
MNYFLKKKNSVNLCSLLDFLSPNISLIKSSHLFWNKWNFLPAQKEPIYHKLSGIPILNYQEPNYQPRQGIFFPIKVIDFLADSVAFHFLIMLIPIKCEKILPCFIFLPKNMIQQTLITE